MGFRSLVSCSRCSASCIRFMNVLSCLPAAPTLRTHTHIWRCSTLGALNRPRHPSNKYGCCRQGWPPQPVPSAALSLAASLLVTCRVALHVCWLHLGAQQLIAKPGHLVCHACFAHLNMWRTPLQPPNISKYLTRRVVAPFLRPLLSVHPAIHVCVRVFLVGAGSCKLIHCTGAQLLAVP